MKKVMNMKKLTITAMVALIVVVISLGGGQLLADPPEHPPGLEIAMEVQEAHTPSLMANPDVVGTAVVSMNLVNQLFRYLLHLRELEGFPGT